jgi:hypothetical protein
MKFLQIRHKLAHILLGNLFLSAALVFFSLTSLSANEVEEPTVLPAIELVAPVQLVNGIVSEVIVLENKNQFAFGDQSLSFVKTGKEKWRVQIQFQNLLGNRLVTESSCALSANQDFLPVAKDAFRMAHFLKKCNDGEAVALKSVANPGLLAFFEICLSQSELPSRNLSTPCVNSLSKSMIPRSANDWRSSWPQAKTTSLWHKSISSWQIQRVSIQGRSLSRSRSMSDTSSIWLSAMDAYPPISVEMTLADPIAAVSQMWQAPTSSLLPKNVR